MFVLPVGSRYCLFIDTFDISEAVCFSRGVDSDNFDISNHFYVCFWRNMQFDAMFCFVYKYSGSVNGCFLL